MVLNGLKLLEIHFKTHQKLPLKTKSCPSYNVLYDSL